MTATGLRNDFQPEPFYLAKQVAYYLRKSHYKGKLIRKLLVAYGLAAVTAIAITTAQAQTTNSQASKLTKADQNFLDDAIQGDLSEIKMGELAQQKGQSQGVKTFGHGDRPSGAEGLRRSD